LANETLISLVSVRSSNNESVLDVSVEKPDLTKQELTLNETLRAMEPGNYSVGVTASAATDYELRFNVSTPRYEEQDDQVVTVEGSVREYSVPEPFNREIGPNSYTECRADDTGEVETSEIVCETHHPITVSKENLDYVLSEQEHQLRQEEKDELESSVAGWKTGFWVTLILSLLLLTAAFFVIDWVVNDYRYTRRKRRL